MAKAKIPVSFSKSKSLPTSDLNSIINDMAIKQLKTKPDFKSIYDEYNQYNPEPSQPKLQRGIEQIPEDVSKGMEEGGPLGAIGGAIKGILDYVNTTEGMRLLSAVDQDPLRQNFYQTRAKQLQEADNNKITAYNDQVTKRKEDISKLFGDYAKHNQTTEHDILSAASELAKQEDQQVFTAGENELNRGQEAEKIALQKARDAQQKAYQNTSLGIELQKLSNDTNKTIDQKKQNVNAKYVERLDKDPVLKKLAMSRAEAKNLLSVINNPSKKITATQIPVMMRTIYDSGNIAQYEQAASKYWGTSVDKARQRFDLMLKGEYSDKDIKEVKRFFESIDKDNEKQIKNIVNTNKEIVKSVFQDSDDSELDKVSNSYLKQYENESKLSEEEKVTSSGKGREVKSPIKNQKIKEI